MIMTGRPARECALTHRHRAGLATALAALLFASGCASTWEVDRFEAPEADLSAKRTFVWKPGDLGTPLARQPPNAASIESQIRAAVTAELARKGYIEVPSASGADMVVSFQVAGSRKFVIPEERRIGAPSPNEVLMPGNIPPPPASELPREQLVRESSVVVFAEEPSSGRLMWRGLVSVESRTSSTEAAIRQITDIARHIAQQFPSHRAAP
jgi:hypothetical protein